MPIDGTDNSVGLSWSGAGSISSHSGPSPPESYGVPATVRCPHNRSPRWGWHRLPTTAPQGIVGQRCSATMVVDGTVGNTGRSSTIEDQRFTRRLYTVAGAARLVGMSPSTLRTWSHGYEQNLLRSTRLKQGPVITAFDGCFNDRRSIPFIGLVEAVVVQAFRNTGLPLQRIRKALEILANEGELEHELASRQLFSDGASVLYDYATRSQDKQLRLLTVVHTGQRVFHEVIDDYLRRITFGDTWATELILPVTERPLLRVIPGVAGGDAVFVEGGATLSAVSSRASAGEPLESIAADFGTPADQIEEALGAIWPAQAAA